MYRLQSKACKTSQTMPGGYPRIFLKISQAKETQRSNTKCLISYVCELQTGKKRFLLGLDKDEHLRQIIGRNQQAINESKSMYDIVLLILTIHWLGG